MAGQRYEKGDTVATLLRIGGGVEKRRLGEVLEVGAQGARVRFVDGETLWLQGGRLWHVVEKDGHQELTKERPASPAKPRPAPPPAALAAIEASGADPFAMWVALGRELVERERHALTMAEEAEASAVASVASAEELLSAEMRALGSARAAVAAARERLATITARMGGSDAR